MECNVYKLIHIFMYHFVCIFMEYLKCVVHICTQAHTQIYGSIAYKNVVKDTIPSSFGWCV